MHNSALYTTALLSYLLVLHLMYSAYFYRLLEIVRMSMVMRKCVVFCQQERWIELAYYHLDSCVYLHVVCYIRVLIFGYKGLILG